MSDVNIRIQAQGGNEAAAQFNKTAAGLTNVSKASGQANTALLNLGRVVQDAPFGFIGIANNIDPLLNSFTQLKSQSGSTKDALKALGSSLLGGAGLGLAVSVATSLLVVFGDQIFASSKKASKAAEDLKKFREEIDAINKSAAAEQANILTLVKALESETTSREKKLGAIKELQRINPEYFGNLTLENGIVNGLKKAYDDYSASIQKAIQNKIDEKRLERVLEKINSEQDRLEKANQSVKFSQTEINDLYSKGGALYAKQLTLLNKQITSTNTLKGFENERDDILKRIADRNFSGVVKSDVEKVKKDTKTVNDVLAELEKTLSALEQQEILFNVDKSRDKIKAFESTIQTLFKDFGLKAGDSVIQSLNERLKGIFISLEREIRNFKPITSLQIKLDEEQARKEIEQATPKLPPIKLPVEVTKNSFDELGKKIQDFLDKASDIRYNTLINSFAGLGDAIGQAIGEGANIGEAIFGNLFKVLGAGLKEIGNALIQLGIAKKALESFKIAPGIGTIIAGIAAIAAGTLLQNIKLPGFADGVTNFKGGFAVVGERGPEVLRLPKGSDVIPNHALNSMMPSSGITYIPNVTLRGSDLVIAFDRANKTNSRNG